MSLLNVGRLDVVDKGGSSSFHYNRLLYTNRDGNLETLLLTDRELSDAMNRVQKNPEWLSAPSFLDRFFCWCINLLK